MVPGIPVPPPTGAKPAPPKPPEPPEPVGPPAPDFPLDPETEYKDFPAEFVAAVAKANGKVTYTARQPNGTWQYVYSPVTPRPKTALPLVRFDYSDDAKKPDPAALPECPVPFGVMVDEYKGGPAAALKPLAAQPNLELLHTRGAVTAAAFEPLAKLAKLTRLTLEKVTDDDGPAAVVKLFPKLTDLDLRGAEKAGAATFAVVATLTDVRHLNLTGCLELTDADTAALAPLKELRTFTYTVHSLNIRRPKLTPKVAEALAGFDQLERIDLRGGPGLGRKIIRFGRLTRLRYLAVGEGEFGWYSLPVADSDLTALAKLPHLAELALDQCYGVSADGWKALCAAPQLKHVHTFGWRPHVTAFVGLEELTLQGWFKTTPEQVAALAAMPNLKRLTLWSPSEVTDKHIAILCEAGRLEELTLHTGDLTDAAFEKTGSLVGLKKLSFAPPLCEFSDAALAHIVKATSLEELSLPRSEKFTAAGFGKLAALKNLKRLTIRPGFAKRDETKKAADELRKALPGCEVILSNF